MIKRKYERPVMTEVQVELEEGFLKASIIDDKGKGAKVEANQQDYVEFDGNQDAGISWE